MPDSAFTPDDLARLAQHAPHLHALESHEGLRGQLRRIEEKEAIALALQDRATDAGLDSAEHPSDFSRFEYALNVAREESAATIELETARVAYITEALDVAKKARQAATLVPVAP